MAAESGRRSTSSNTLDLNQGLNAVIREHKYERTRRLFLLLILIDTCAILEETMSVKLVRNTDQKDESLRSSLTPEGLLLVVVSSPSLLLMLS